MPNRARVLALAAGVGLSAVPLPGRSQELTTLRITCVPNDDVSPLLWAQSSGLFRKAGLDVQVQRNTSGAAIAAAVAGGAYDIGLASMMALISGHAHGLPFVMIAGSLLYLASDPAGLLLVLKDSPLRSGRDLPGKLVSVSSIGDVNWVGTKAWVEQMGVSPETIKFVEIPQTAAAAALEAKRIDAALLLNPNLEAAMATGHFRSIGQPHDGIAKRWMVAAWFAMSEWAAKNRDLVDRFAQAMRTATIYANTHHAETAPLLAAFSGIEAAYVMQMKRVTCAETLDARDIQPAIDAAAKYKVIERGFPAQDLIGQFGVKTKT